MSESTATIFATANSPFQLRLKGEPAGLDGKPQSYQEGELLACAPARGTPLYPGDVIVMLRQIQGVVSIDIELSDHEPPVAVDGWNVVEEIGVEFDGGSSLSVYNGKDDLGLANARHIHVGAGWHTLRASCAARGGEEQGATLKLQIWPATGPHQLIQLHRQPTPPSASSDNLTPPQPRRSVTEQWALLRSALSSQGAISTLSALREGADQIDIDRAVAATVGAWPLELEEWFRVVNGSDAVLFPGYNLLSVAECRAIWRRTRDAWSDLMPSDFPAMAGLPTFGYIAAYVPIAELDGYMLVCDCRGGDSRGAVIQFDKVDADDGTRTWNNLSDLLESLVTAIETSTTWGGWQPTITDGTLVWNLPDSPAR